MKNSIVFLAFTLFLTGCPNSKYEGTQIGERRSIFIDGNNICFTLKKEDVLNRYSLVLNGKIHRRLLVDEGVSLSYPYTCFKVNLAKGFIYGASYTLNSKHYYYTFIIDNEGTILDLGR